MKQARPASAKASAVHRSLGEGGKPARHTVTPLFSVPDRPRSADLVRAFQPIHSLELSYYGTRCFSLNHERSQLVAFEASVHNNKDPLSASLSYKRTNTGNECCDYHP